MIAEKKNNVMRRVAFAKSEPARSCLGCGRILCTALPSWVERLECPHCGTITQVKHTDHGTVVLTDEDYADLFLHESTKAQIWMREENEDDE